MPRPLTITDPTPQVPDVSDLSWWDEYQPRWCQVISQCPVDVIRTEALADWEVRRTTAGKTTVVPIRVSGYTPLQLVGKTMTRVYEAKNPRSVLWNPSTWVQVPLQQQVWISNNNDHTWFAVDPLRRFYYEAGSFGPMPGGYWWRADTVRVFNMNQQWTNNSSISASRIPVWALVPTIEELDRGAGGVKRALPFVAAGYGIGQPIWPSRGTDGYLLGHPLVNGSRMRFTRRAVERLGPQVKTQHDAALLWAGAEYGFLNVDKTSESAGHSVRLPQDPRLNITLRFTLADMEVVYA